MDFDKLNNPEFLEKLKSVKTLEELKALAQEEGVELSGVIITRLVIDSAAPVRGRAGGYGASTNHPEKSDFHKREVVRRFLGHTTSELWLYSAT